MDQTVANVFARYPLQYREPLMQIRQLVFDVAARLPAVGEIEETLKWGQPTYTSKTGTPIRLDRFEEDKIALFVHCQTTLINDFSQFHDTLAFSKNRAIIIDPEKELPFSELALFIEKALTYHIRKRKT